MFGEPLRSSLQAHLELPLLKEPCTIRPVFRTSHTIVSPGGHWMRDEFSTVCLPGSCAHAPITRIRSVLVITRNAFMIECPCRFFPAYSDYISPQCCCYVCDECDRGLFQARILTKGRRLLASLLRASLALPRLIVTPCTIAETPVLHESNRNSDRAPANTTKENTSPHR